MVDGLVRLEAIQEDQRIPSRYCTAKLKLVAHPVGIRVASYSVVCDYYNARSNAKLEQASSLASYL